MIRCRDKRITRYILYRITLIVSHLEQWLFINVITTEAKQWMRNKSRLHMCMHTEAIGQACNNHILSTRKIILKIYLGRKATLEYVLALNKHCGFWLNCQVPTRVSWCPIATGKVEVVFRLQVKKRKHWIEELEEIDKIV